ncbi:MAG: hypothetical protein PQJ58_15560 [Spirochaetales bacterium]|nr:hypothetical protein [Spirochaetales bacterium]
MKRSFLLVSLIFAASVLPLAAQSNSVLDEFLNNEAADAGTALLLVAQAIGDLPDSASAEDALQWKDDQKWGRKVKLEKDDPVTSGQFHLALLKAFEIKGGMGYTLFASPRSAAQEAAYQGFIPGAAYVNHKMTPYEVLNSLSLALERQEEEE